MGSSQIIKPKLMWICLVFTIGIGVIATVVATNRTFTIVNNCGETIWLGLYGNIMLPVSGAGLEMEQQETIQVSVGEGWMGRMWGRTGCTFDATGVGSCATGDCGGMLDCAQTGDPPASLAEFNIQRSEDFYDVSLVDGYNLEMSIATSAAKSGNCSTAGCISDLNSICPPVLQEVDAGGNVIACKSACDAFQQPQYCCTGPYSSPQTCQPTNYSRIFKQACPTAYSYAYDDPSSTFTCVGADYTLTFC